MRKLQQTQAQVDEVVGIMKTNVEKVIERDTKLSMLDERAEALNLGASQFEQAGKRLRRKYWWQNCKVITAYTPTVFSITTNNITVSISKGTGDRKSTR